MSHSAYNTLAQDVDALAESLEYVERHDISETPYASLMDLAIVQAGQAIAEMKRIARELEQGNDDRGERADYHYALQQDRMLGVG
jgi:hypothetical protein